MLASSTSSSSTRRRPLNSATVPPTAGMSSEAANKGARRRRVARDQTLHPARNGKSHGSCPTARRWPDRRGGIRGCTGWRAAIGPASASNCSSPQGGESRTADSPDGQASVESRRSCYCGRDNELAAGHAGWSCRASVCKEGSPVELLPAAPLPRHPRCFPLASAFWAPEEDSAASPRGGSCRALCAPTVHATGTERYGHGRSVTDRVD
jgi:hypothetical protein